MAAYKNEIKKGTKVIIRLLHTTCVPDELGANCVVALHKTKKKASIRQKDGFDLIYFKAKLACKPQRP